MDNKDKECHFIGSFMKPYEEYIRAMARAEKPMLFIGESGTGKELATEIVEDELANKKKFTVNCTRFDNRTEAISEIFGHKKGSYTGADYNREGILKEANNNIVFFDELGELDQGVQAILLRFSEDGKVVKYGGDESNTKDCSVSKVLLLAATTHPDRIHSALINRFSAIYLPPLRWRVIIRAIKKEKNKNWIKKRSDILELAKHFIQGKGIGYISEGILDYLTDSGFREGNVRELKYLLDKLVIANKQGMPLNSVMPGVGSILPLWMESDDFNIAQEDYYIQAMSTSVDSIDDYPSWCSAGDYLVLDYSDTVIFASPWWLSYEDQFTNYSGLLKLDNNRVEMNTDKPIRSDQSEEMSKPEVGSEILASEIDNLKLIEKATILRAYKRELLKGRGAHARTAIAVGLSERQLSRKLKYYGVKTTEEN